MHRTSQWSVHGEAANFNPEKAISFFICQCAGRVPCEAALDAVFSKRCTWLAKSRAPTSFHYHNSNLQVFWWQRLHVGIKEVIRGKLGTLFKVWLAEVARRVQRTDLEVQVQH